MAENSYHVVVNDNASGSGTILDGFTITGGDRQRHFYPTRVGLRKAEGLVNSQRQFVRNTSDFARQRAGTAEAGCMNAGSAALNDVVFTGLPPVRWRWWHVECRSDDTERRAVLRRIVPYVDGGMGMANRGQRDTESRRLHRKRDTRILQRSVRRIWPMSPSATTNGEAACSKTSAQSRWIMWTLSRTPRIRCSTTASE